MKSLTAHELGDLESKSILALDLGMRTGWCIGENGKPLDSGVHMLYDQKHTDFTDGERFSAFYAFLTQNMGIDAIVFEQVAGGTKGRQTVLFNGYRATLLLYAQMLGKPCLPLPVGTIKKYVTGKGNASKQEMIDAVRSLGHPTFDDNEADAIGAFYTANWLNANRKVAAEIQGERE